MNYNERIGLMELYDIYGNMLTNNQKEVFEEYYFDNLSLSEIADNHNISRQAVDFTLKNVVKSLTNYESKLKIDKKLKRICNELLEIKNCCKDSGINLKIDNLISNIKE